MRQLILFLTLIAVIFPSQSKKYAWEYDYKKLEKEATKGDAISQLWMGHTFEEGRFNMVPDHHKAFEWYLKSAKQDINAAQYQVAMMYHEGRGVEKDEIEFIHWLKACANYKYDTDEKFTANLLIADFIGNGTYGMEKNVEKAIDLTKKAKLNYIDLSGRNYYLYAMQFKQLGQLYNILATEGDWDVYSKAREEAAKAFEEEAKSWSRWKAETSEEYQKAKENMGNAWTNSAIAWILYIPEDSTMQEKINSKIVEALKCAAHLGHTGATYGLGEFYYYGELGLPQNKGKAIEMLLKIANVNNRAAFIVASDFYDKKQYQEALKYFTLLTEMDGVDDDVRSSVLRSLSSMYRFGRGVEKDEKKADSLISEAVKLGDPDASKIQEWLRLF